MNRLQIMVDQIQKLENVRGVKELINESAVIFKNPIVMFDTEYNLLAFNEVKTDDSITIEIIQNGTFCLKTQSFFSDEGFIEEVANCPHIAILKSDKLKYNRISGKLFNKNNTYVANLVMVGSNQAIEESDIEAFDFFCVVLSREISRNQFYQQYAQAHQEMLMRNLIDGNYDVNLDVAQVGILYDSLATNLYVAVANISQKNNDYFNPKYLRDILMLKKPSYKYAVYLDQLIILFSTNKKTFKPTTEFEELFDLFEKNNVYLGISSRFENLFELKKYYLEASDCLNASLNDKKRITIYSDLKVKSTEKR